ncbi:protein RKD1 [Artemisia annua]|uniref:Protein RKD1 n=1 Tax=Artemisia annua TaxID=35608 RepID=A0A2U1KKI2_ARTAN|nr:protein RKD1 [Artemisia annua]
MPYDKDTISKYFHMTIKQAAKELNVGLSTLKYNCRYVGINRWPYRKLKSLKTLINDYQFLLSNVSCNNLDRNDVVGNGGAQLEDDRQEIIKMLKEEKRLLENNPNVQLARTTKRLIACNFKSKYQKMKTMCF